MANHSSRSAQPTATTESPRKASSRSGMLLSFCAWLGLWALLGRGEGWAFGIPVAAAATFATIRLQLNWRPLRLSALAAVFGIFLRELFSGGWDVARRALHPRMPIAPGWQTFNMKSRNPRVRLLLSAMIGLLPGTLSSDYDGFTLHIHALDQQQNWEDTVVHLESLLSRLLGDS